MTATRDVGWYRDPAHPDQHRFWDGRRWQRQADHLRLALLDSRGPSTGDEAAASEDPPRG
ncbi:DUF2510 domain-containing protein [Nocardioides marmoraquaticus]